MSKQDLEEQKLFLEIQNLNKPWRQRISFAEVLKISLTALLVIGSVVVTLEGDLLSDRKAKIKGQEALLALSQRKLDSLETKTISLDSIKGSLFKFNDSLQVVISQLLRATYTQNRTAINITPILFNAGSNAPNNMLQLGSELAQIINIVSIVPDVTLNVVGYGDSLASDEESLRISDLRATGILNYLIQNGADSTRITSVGLGKNPKRNGTVEIFVLDGE